MNQLVFNFTAVFLKSWHWMHLFIELYESGIQHIVRVYMHTLFCKVSFVLKWFDATVSVLVSQVWRWQSQRILKLWTNIWSILRPRKLLYWTGSVTASLWRSKPSWTPNCRPPSAAETRWTPRTTDWKSCKSRNTKPAAVFRWRHENNIRNTLN